MNIVHVGYPKTATTFLQKQVFPNMEGVSYVDYKTCVKLFEEVIYYDDFDYERRQVEQKLLPQMSSKKINLFSLESLTGAPFTFKGLNRSNVPLRLKELGFDRIIITIRNQQAMVDSLYRQYVYQGGVMKFKDFLNLEKKWNPYVQAFHLGYLRYDRLVEKYQEVFGVENVLVLPQELLRRDKSKFFDLLEQFVGTSIQLPKHASKSNESVSNLSTNLIRIINHFTFNSQKPNNLITNYISTRTIKRGFQVIVDPYFLRMFSKKSSLLSADQSKKISDFYHESNTRLNNLIHTDLEELGYFNFE